MFRIATCWWAVLKEINESLCFAKQENFLKIESLAISQDGFYSMELLLLLFLVLVNEIQYIYRLIDHGVL